MRGAVEVHRALLESGVEHTLVHLGRPLSTADDLPEVLGLAPSECLVVRLYALGAAAGARRPGDPRGLAARDAAAVAVPAGHQPHPRALHRLLGTDAVREASPEEASAVTDCWAGLITPVGLPAGMPLLLDVRLTTAALLHAPTGEAGTALRLTPAALVAVTGATVCDLTGGVPGSVDLVDGAGPADVDLSGDGPATTRPGAGRAGRRRRSP